MKSKHDWLFQLRKCSNKETLEKVAESNRYKRKRTKKYVGVRIILQVRSSRAAVHAPDSMAIR